MEADTLQNKFIAVLNKKIPVGFLMNALGHMVAGLAGSYSNISEMRFDSYVDKSGGEHKSISDHPFIILAAANGNQIRSLRNELLAAGIHFVDFTSTMTVGTYAEQKERTNATPEPELEYYGLCAFGNKITLSQLTKKFSLWK
ncbi:hypothetical protein A2973_02860 [Candidatus Gottesmanbacteria bacterium RIFCSPLOWO2_01_FULL_49_10]|uniref:DUF2000 domain-containing protein n=1 Tax=Candidatus Gottesmanbacteria bacterium RIFCSPLOWO2_01_FULL_49_10 TaxID=1798396 RepID=A0A1F6AXQ4_9BACT|nr:MAG: hypothetical protein A2973_02860 [Candidatus Gottesmanbacteria bacterium RIFCSPLOWO2_01_FULL_49_10]